MKMKIKRILCLVLSALMIVSVFPVMAGAGTVDEVTFEVVEGTEGVSNENYPNLIDNKNDTKWCVSNFSSAYIIIKASEASQSADIQSPRVMIQHETGVEIREIGNYTEAIIIIP